ncbi:MAG: toll/interleukin-1 receptor domain-containing protein [Candidatus Sulfotelmatobacter sp.]
MANPQHLFLLQDGVEGWNQWRRENPDVRPNLREADLSRADLRDAHLASANLGEAKLFSANLNGANLSGANIIGADLSEADLDGADLTGAWAARALFVNLDLRGVKGLDAMVHSGPSTVGIDTIYKSNGTIPASFLRGCGVPEALITYIPSLVAAQAGIEYNSLFICYATEDHEFAERLSVDLEANGYRCWFTPRNSYSDEWMPDQVDQAIQMQDRLLLIISKDSMNSRWAKEEVQKAYNRGVKENRRVLYPVSIRPIEELAKWEEIQPDAGKESAHELRQYFIPNFSNWPDHYSYRQVFNEFLRDLRRNAKPDRSSFALDSQAEQAVA